MKHTLSVLLLLFAINAWSNNNPEFNDDPLLVTFYPAKDMVYDLHTQQVLREQAAWQNFVAAHGTWYVHFNEQNQKPHRAYGQPISTYGSTPAEQALNFVENYLGNFNIPTSDLQLTSTPEGRKYQYVNFRQTYQGLDILNSRLMVKLFNGQVIMFGADVFSDIELDTNPSLAEDGALAAALADITLPVTSTTVQGLSIIAVPTGYSNTYHLVYEVQVNTLSATGIPANYHTLVDAHTGEIMYRDNLVRHIDNCPTCAKKKKVLTMGMLNVSGNVSAEVYPIGPYEGTSTEGLPFLEINTGGDTFYTDIDGNFTTTVTGPSMATIPLSGLWSTVYTNNVTPSLNTNLVEGNNNVSYDGSANIKELSAYRSVNLIHEHMKQWMPANFTSLDYSMVTNIDVDGECNAFYDGTINFFDIGGGCNATSLIADVIYHEYGHGINDKYYQTQGEFFTNGAMGEGYADFWAISLTDNPHLGQGFYTDNEDGIRRYDEDPKVYPVDLVGEVHADGEIIMGAWYDTHLLMGADWDATLELFVEAYGGLQATTFNGNEGAAFVDVLLDALQADDDDGDISNGTPNDASIVDGFYMHGITLISNATLNHDDIEEHEANQDIDIVTGLILNFPFSQYLSQGSVFYRINGDTDWSSAPLELQSGIQYSATIPAQPEGTVVYYYLGLEDIYGHLSGIQPVGAELDDPNLPYVIVVGSSVILEHDFDFSEDLGFWQAGVAGDNSTTGDWEFDTPVGSFGTFGDLSTVVAPYEDHTPGAGEFCFVTENTVDPTAGIGTNDVDGGHTTLRSANIDLTEFSNPIVAYWRWYTNAPPSGANPGQDWWYVQVSDDGGDNWTFIEETRSQDIKWRRNAFRVQDYVDITDEFRMQFIASDSTHIGQYLDGGSLIEAALDDILVYEAGIEDNVEELAQQTFISVYPNPATDVLFVNIRSQQGEKVSIQLVDLTGKVVIDQRTKASAADSKHRIDLGDCSPGMYLLQVKAGDKLMSEKVTIRE
ncbi:MAG: T9SS type A sorting domain-containing protein [Flavobacteriales bacterium]|nr:T9SS type A sorting domain-containing protein [Flavobacteriales bacterium]